MGRIAKISSPSISADSLDAQLLEFSSSPKQSSRLSYLDSRSISRITEDVSNFKQMNFDVNKVIEVIGIDNNKLIARTIDEMSPEDLADAYNENKLGTYEKNEDGEITIKFHELLAKKLESVAINAVEIQGHEGTQIYTTFNLKTLSSEELNLLTTQIKTHIAFLKSVENPKDESDKTQKKIEKYELRLRYLEIERAARIDNKEKLKILLDDLVNTSSYKIAREAANIIAKLREEKKSEEAEKELQDLKFSIIKKEIIHNELFREIIKNYAIHQEINSNDILKDKIKNDKKDRILINMGHFIELYDSNKIERIK